MTLRERIEWLLKIGILVFILAAAAFLSAITAMRVAIHGRIVQVPNLVGLDSRSAQKSLSSVGLAMRVADRVYSDVAPDRVIRQIPRAGEQVKVGQQAQVVLSLGPRKVTIPLLEGRSLRAARIELLRAGLQLGEVSSTYLANSEADTVVVQDPSPGATAASPHVNLLVSEGEREAAYVMPALTGLSQTEAQRQLALAGLRAVKLSFVPLSAGVHGMVLAQSPPQGVRVTPSRTVELQIAE
jgi:beta-lactam-binding protein with PASTA domain